MRIPVVAHPVLPILLLLFAFQDQAAAQAYRFRIFGIDEGLGNLAVTCVTQDAKGYIWAGTLNGLYRYDGAHFQRFGREQGLAESQIVSLANTADGSLWAATTNGLAVFRNGQFSAVSFGGTVNVAALAVEPQTDTVWLATNRGIQIIEASVAGQKILRAHLWKELPAEDFAAVGFGADGSRWFSGKHALYRWKAGVLSKQGAASGVPEDDWQAILSDKEGTLWLRSPTKLLDLKPGASRFVDQSAGLPPAEVAALGLESNGHIAVPTIRGLARRVDGRWQIIGTRSGLPMDSISSVFFDREGSPWIGTNGGGLAQWLGFGRWESWTSPTWVENDATWSFAEDKEGTIWAGTNLGIISFELAPAELGAVPKMRFHLKSGVRSVALGSQGEIWAGTAHHGVFRCGISARTCRQLGAGSGLTASAINSLLIEDNGLLWVATDTGVFTASTLEGSLRFTEQHFPGGAKGQLFRQVIKGRNGEILVAGKPGLWRRSKNGWTHLTTASGLLDNDLAQVQVDQGGAIWLSYLGDLGVSRLREGPEGAGVWEHFTQNDALRSNYIYALLVDRSQRIWVGSDQGIDAREGSEWKHYGTADGLIWPDLNTAALLGDSRGGLWVGTSHGISHFLASRQVPRPPPPVPIVTQVQVNGRDRDLAKPIAIPYGHNEVTLHFSSLSFLDESRIRYRYKIDGLQDQWRSSEDRDVHLLDLPPGNYSFALMATTLGGSTSTQAAKLQLVVETPWWRMRAFLVFSSIALVGILRGLWIWRMKAVLGRQRDLEAAVAERTQELTLGQERLTRAREAYAYQANHDSLTNLANRNGLNEFLGRLSEHGPRAVVLCIDLDRFKAVNDSCGHHIGDLLLQEAADRLRQEIREEDLIARIGGDEFVAVLMGTNEADACRLADRLLARLAQAFQILHHSFAVTASVGIAQYPEHGNDPALLLRNADMAMYNAKKSGKNMYRVFTPSLAEDVAGPVDIERQLHGALLRGEMYLVYQPQVTADGRVEAVEALVRWCNPALGIVPPSSFIPIAEEIGAIGAIGEWVLQTACEQIATWHQAGHWPRLAVNVSVLQLSRADFADTVEQILAASNLDPAYLELEITETAVMQNTTECIRQMNKLRERKVRVAIDDFGTGNSSLSYLRMLPVDTIKIDRSFVSPLEATENNQFSMIRAIIGLARGLGFRVIAEGVESEYQAAVLREEGCDGMQGYLFYRPLRADAIWDVLVNATGGLQSLNQPATF